MTERDLSTRASDWELIVEARARRARGDLAALAGRDECHHERAAADNLERAIAEVIREGKSVTYDMKPTRSDPSAVGTSQVADAIIEKLGVRV